MVNLLTVRGAVLSLEKAWRDKYALAQRCTDHANITPRNLKGALEAQVVITLPADTRGVELVDLLMREGQL